MDPSVDRLPSLNRSSHGSMLCSHIEVQRRTSCRIITTPILGTACSRADYRAGRLYRVGMWISADPKKEDAGSRTESSGYQSLDRDEEDSKPEPATTGVRRECRVLTAVVVAAAALGVLGKWNYDRSQLRFLTAIENPAEYFQAKVERVDIYQERIHAVVFCPMRRLKI